MLEKRLNWLVCFCVGELFIKMQIIEKNIMRKSVGCRLKANYQLMGPGPIGGVPSVGVFLRNPSPYLLEFLRKPQNTANG